MPVFFSHNNSTVTSVAKEVHHVKRLMAAERRGGEAGGNGSRWVVAFEAMAKW